MELVLYLLKVVTHKVRICRMKRLKRFGAVQLSLFWAILRSTVLIHITVHMILQRLREIRIFQQISHKRLISSFLERNPRIILKTPEISRLYRLNSSIHNSVKNFFENPAYVKKKHKPLQDNFLIRLKHKFLQFRNCYNFRAERSNASWCSYFVRTKDISKICPVGAVCLCP